MTGKLIIFSAPSGSGKSTIINYLLTQNLNLAFSISATSRPPRGTEQHGVEYFFLTPEEFRQRIENNEFLEYEEVYKDRYYGTLKAQVEKQLEAGQNVVFDVDVVGGCNIKKFYGDRALSVFIQPPSVEELRCRLEGRGTDAPEVIESRIAKAEYELSFASQFDCVIPLKAQEKLWNDELRLELVKLSISDYPRFQASDFEFHLPRPSYSVYTLEKLREAFPDREFYFIIGSDNWERFGYWYQSERIIKENQILIYPRPGFPVKEEELPETVRLVHSPVFEISSTFIREALDAGKDVRYFVHPKVWETIKER